MEYRGVTIVRPEQARIVKALIMSQPGVGKTHFLGTALEDDRTSPILILDFEGGTGTLAGLPVDVIQVRDWQDYNQAYAFLAKAPHEYKSVAIDSISETHVFALMNILDTREGGNRKMEDLIDQQDYGKGLIQMRRLIRQFRDLDMHFFLTSHVKDEKDPREGMVKKPSMAGRMADEIIGMMDVCAYLSYGKNPETDEEERVMVLKNYPRVRAKVRTPWKTDVPDELWNPTVTALFDALHIPHVEPDARVTVRTQSTSGKGA